jgi:transposase
LAAAQLPPKTPVAIEASGTWWWLVDLLEGLGHQRILSHPKQTKAIAAARLKNDRVDAQRLALLLRGDLFPTVWIPPAALREARELIRHRVQLVWLRGELRNRQVAMLARRNLRPTSGKSWFTMRGQREFERLPLPTIPSRLREDYRALLPLLDAHIRQLDHEITQRWGDDPRVQRLCTIPGIGPFIATVLVLELGDIARFAHAKQVASYVGLTPRVRASGDRIRSDRITKEGNRLLRWVLVLAATQAVRRPRTIAGVVPRREAAARPKRSPRRAGPTPRGDCLSRVETGVRLLHRHPARCRARVSPSPGLVPRPRF